MSLYKHYSTQFNGVLKIVEKYHPQIAEGCFFKENNTTYFRNKDNPVNTLMIEFIESIGKIPSYKNNAVSLDKNANNVQLNWNKFIIFVKTNKMKENLVSLETAMLAKEFGFKIETHDYFSKTINAEKYRENYGFDSGYWGDNYFYDWNTLGEPFKPFSSDCISRPTQSLLAKYLREIYKVQVEPVYDELKNVYNCHFFIDGKNYNLFPNHISHEDAFDFGLIHAMNELIALSKIITKPTFPEDRT